MNPSQPTVSYPSLQNQHQLTLSSARTNNNKTREKIMKAAHTRHDSLSEGKVAKLRFLCELVLGSISAEEEEGLVQW